MSDAALTSPLTAQTAGVIARLAQLRQRMALWLLVYGLARVLWCAIGLVALDLALDWFFRMDRPQRGVMLALMLGVVGYVIYRRLVLPLSATASDDALCLQIEAKHQELGQNLISALQLARLENVAGRGMSPAMVQETVRSGAAAASGLNFGSVLNSRKFNRNAGLAAVAALLIVALGFGAAASNLLATGLSRNLLLSERTWPQQTYLEVLRAKNGVVVFPRSEDWTQVVAVTPESRVVPESVSIDFRRARGRNSQAMKKVVGEARKFEAMFASVIEPFEFRARGGDALTPWIRVELVDQPAVESLTLAIAPPKYTNQSQQTLPAGKGPYYVLPGSSLSLSGVANKALAKAELLIDDQPQPLSLSSATQFRGGVPAGELKAGQYTLQLHDTLGLTSRRPTSFGLRIRADREPRVRARLVGVSGMVTTKARVPLSARLSDDFGITRVQLNYQWRGDDAERADGKGSLEFEEVKNKLGASEISFDAAIELESLKIPTGTGLNFHIAAADNDDVSGPNTGKSSDFLLRIVTEEELRTDLLRREKEQRQEFERLIKSQEDLLTDTRALAAGVKAAAVLAPEQKDLLMQFQRRQKQIGASVAAIVERMQGIVLEVQNNRLEAVGGRLQSRLQNDIATPLADLSAGGVPLAMQQLDQTRRLAAEPASRTAALTAAAQTQQEIVVRMKQILTHMTDAEGYQEAVNLLYEIQKMQQDVLDRTLKEKQQRIQGILEGKTPTGEKP